MNHVCLATTHLLAGYVIVQLPLELFLNAPSLEQFREHSGNIQGTFREHSGNIQGTFREQFREHSGNNSGNIQGTFREHSGNIQGTFREHSGNICDTMMGR
jgi:hypothetical protein